MAKKRAHDGVLHVGIDPGGVTGIAFGVGDWVVAAQIGFLSGDDGRIGACFNRWEDSFTSVFALSRHRFARFGARKVGSSVVLEPKSGDWKGRGSALIWERSSLRVANLCWLMIEDVFSAFDCHLVNVQSEDFILGSGGDGLGASSGRVGLSPVRIGSHLYAGYEKAIDECWCGEIDYRVAMAGVAKGMFTDDRLRAHGLYTPGMPHANDACRHYLLGINRSVRD